MRGTACGAIGSVLVVSLVVVPPCVGFAGGGGVGRGGSGVVGACPAPTWPFGAEAAKAGVEFFPVGGVIGLHGAGVADDVVFSSALSRDRLCCLELAR